MGDKTIAEDHIEVWQASVDYFLGGLRRAAPSDEMRWRERLRAAETVLAAIKASVAIEAKWRNTPFSSRGLIFGTSHFVSTRAAVRYYAQQSRSELVSEKLATGEISIGPPPVKAGDILLIIDDGTRYGILEAVGGDPDALA